MNVSGVVYIGSSFQTQIWNNYGIVSIISSLDLSLYSTTNADFYNFGLVEINETFASETVAISIAFNNSGTLRVNNGVFYFNYSGTHDGTFIHNSGSQIIFSAGTNILTNLSTVENGTGIVFSGKSIEKQMTNLNSSSFHKTRRCHQYSWKFYAQCLYNNWINNHFLYSI